MHVHTHILGAQGFENLCPPHSQLLQIKPNDVQVPGWFAGR